MLRNLSLSGRVELRCLFFLLLCSVAHILSTTKLYFLSVETFTRDISLSTPLSFSTFFSNCEPSSFYFYCCFNIICVETKISNKTKNMRWVCGFWSRGGSTNNNISITPHVFFDKKLSDCDCCCNNSVIVIQCDERPTDRSTRRWTIETIKKTTTIVIF